MFEPLIKNLVRKLDIAAEAYLERQQMINLLAVPGTLLFLLLFWAFSGAGGFMLVLGLFVVAIEVGIAVGLFLLKDKYEDQELEWAVAACSLQSEATAQGLTEALLSNLEYREIGPTRQSGRFVDIAVPSQQPYTFYIATASGQR